MRPAKVLVCHNHYKRRGGEAQVFENLVRWLRGRGHAVLTYERHNEAACAYCQHQRSEPGQSGVLGLLEA